MIELNLADHPAINYITKIFSKPLSRVTTLTTVTECSESTIPLQKVESPVTEYEAKVVESSHEIKLVVTPLTEYTTREYPERL
ncbi:hypothetical protein HK098_004991 [Nowakowskiella sp. JEL0407]|nr:hypothetical protein HK098_004991 [Nowakowskiella sp. JEL0407]